SAGSTTSSGSSSATAAAPPPRRATTCARRRPPLHDQLVHQNVRRTGAGGAGVSVETDRKRALADERPRRGTRRRLELGSRRAPSGLSRPSLPIPRRLGANRVRDLRKRPLVPELGEQLSAQRLDELDVVRGHLCPPVAETDRRR